MMMMMMMMMIVMDKKLLNTSLVGSLFTTHRQKDKEYEEMHVKRYVKEGNCGKQNTM
jgi:hypothetical protein